MRISSNDIVVRAPINKDFGDINKLLGQLHDKHVTAVPTFYRQNSSFMEEKEFLEMINNYGNIVLIAESIELQKVVGFLSGEIRRTQDTKREIDRKNFWLDSIVVDDTMKRLGIASLLINYLELELKKSNIEEMRLMVWEFNEEAKKFFESTGMSLQASVLKKDVN